MNVLVIGSGGREHAIALKISESKKLKVLYCLPGNPGTDSCALNLTVDIKNHQAIINICKEKQIDLVIIGPEQPLVDGLSDQLRNEGIKVFGPSSNASRIESSKAFAKKIMSDASVPTANYMEFSSHQLQESLKYIETVNYPTVIKADGLAAGKASGLTGCILPN